MGDKPWSKGWIQFCEKPSLYERVCHFTEKPATLIANFPHTLFHPTISTFCLPSRHYIQVSGQAQLGDEKNWLPRRTVTSIHAVEDFYFFTHSDCKFKTIVLEAGVPQFGTTILVILTILLPCTLFYSILCNTFINNYRLKKQAYIHLGGKIH